MAYIPQQDTINTKTDLISVNGAPIQTVADGIQVHALAGPTGDPYGQIGDTLPVTVQNTISTAPTTKDFYNVSSSTAMLLFPQADVSLYQTAYVQVSGTFVATYQFQGSNDGSTWVVMPAVNLGIQSVTTGTTTTGLFEVVLKYRYFRIILASYTSGTVNCFVRLTSLPTTSLVNMPVLANSSVSTFTVPKEVFNTLNTNGGGVQAVGALAQFDDVSPTLTTENQFAPMRQSTNRNLYTTIRDGSGGERGANVDQLGNLNIKGDTYTTNILENILQAVIDLQTAIDPAGLTNLQRKLDNIGREVVTVGNSRDKIKTAVVTLSNTTTETTLIPGISGSYCDILAILVSNTSASTNTRVDLRDYPGGAVIAPIQSVGGGSPSGISLGGVAIPQTTAGSNWTAQCAIATTDIRILVIYSVNN